MTATETPVKCRCGRQMITTKGGAHICENCDQAQPQERMGFDRRKTHEDIRFEMSWLQEEEASYTDNTKKKGVGTPHTEGDTPPDSDEGGTTNG